uniref:APG6 domain-containing protein n=1 Tax=Rhabditophanes sp. KR3021 TaxID=114890 RepID=A0AC35U6Z1_9BILA
MIETRAQVEQDEENGRRLLAELKEKESSLCKQLLELNEEEKSLLNQTEELEKLEQKVKDDYSQNYCSLRDIHSDMTSLTLKEANFNGIISSSRDHLEVLTKTNVLNKTFYINVDEKDIGSINGLRLVRLSNENTTIAESNAAWGQCVLCLHVLFNLNQIKATPYELIPVGAFSTIVYTDDAGVKDVKNLHQNSFAIYRSSSYDTAIGYFLNCLRKFDTEFRTKVKVPNNTIFPNTIYKDKIAEGFVPDVNNQSVIWYSGKISLNKHERWTKAMRLMLLNLKAAILATAIAKGI